MSLENSDKSDSGQTAAVRQKPQPNGAAGEPQSRRNRDLANQARELIFGGGKTAEGVSDENRQRERPNRAGDEGGKPDTRDQPVRQAPEGRPDATGETRGRPALDLDDDESYEEQAPKRRRSKTIAEHAAELEVDPQEIYKLAVPIGDDGQTLTIGELKDQVREHHDFQRRRDDFEDYRDEAMGEVANARMQIDGVLQRLTGVVAPQDLARAFADYQ